MTAMRAGVSRSGSKLIVTSVTRRASWASAAMARSRRGQAPGFAGVDLILVEALLPEVHDVRAAELFLQEVDREQRRELLLVPGVRLQELLVVLARLVPLGEQRRREVDALPVPGLRD